MDVSKLDKMKVIDLRKELETRGLDTKGVKAVLVERLRAFLEDGIGAAPGTPGTPGRRCRRTRSMTRSPSPSPVKVAAVEPNLETLAEEEDNGNSEDVPAKEDVKEIISEAEVIEEQNQEQEPEPEENDVEEHIESEAVEKIEQNGEESKEEVVEEENEKEEEEEAIQQDEEHEVEGEVNKSDIEAAEQAHEDNDKQMDVDQDNEQEVVLEKEQEVVLEKEQEVVQDNEQKVDQDDRQEEKEVKEDTEKNNEKNLEKNKTAVNREKRTHSPSHSKEHHDRSHSRSRSRSHSRSRSRSKSRSRTPKRRSGAGSHGTPSKAEEATNPEDEPTIEDKQFGLSWFDSDLHLRIDPVTFTSAKPMSHEIYSLIWSGARTNYGVREGKVCFEVRLAEETQLGRTHQFRDEPHVRGFRVGFSLPDTTLLLGEAEHSFAYCESGRKATNSEFTDFSKPYQLDDVIGCYLDLESTPCTIKYTLNGEDVGVAFEFDKSILGENGALFPHIVTKGYEYHVNFADNENLLANVERPKRMRRIPKKEKVVEKEKEKEKDKTEKPKDETSKAPEENDTKSEEGDAAKAKTAIDEDEEMQDKTEADNEAESEKVVEKTEETQPTGNVVEQEEQKSGDKAENVEENGDTQTAVDDKTADNKDGENAKESKRKEEEETDGPSPSKRKRLDDDKEKQEKRRESSDDDEYEEIIPELRETVTLLPDYELIALIPEEKYVPGPQRPNSRKECEVILLVGLPGAGKTHWALQHIKENAEKRYHVIGADSLIAKMTIDGAPRKPLHKGRWERVYELCLNNLSPLEEIATKRRRNFILDQPTLRCHQLIWIGLTK
uniref:Heterogeneous nuclear ribonucleoprotein U-like protein 1 n=1 Tax=Zeugodacus cucurbitae TaxID=28588 RepID=A0A0A1WKD5_ZEUCU